MMRFILVGILFLVWGCSSTQNQPMGSPLYEKGRGLYLSQCSVCHGPHPSQNGPVGPSLAGSSQALLEAKLLSGTYPPGYQPKRDSKQMPSFPHLRKDIPAFVDFLNAHSPLQSRSLGAESKRANQN